MKHVGRLRATGHKLIIAFREMPADQDSNIHEDPHHCLVIEIDSLPDLYQKEMQDCLESNECQTASHAGEVLGRKRFASGENMFGYMHMHGFLRKVKVTEVDLTPTPGTAVPLTEINNLVRTNSGKQKVTYEPAAQTVPSAPVVPPAAVVPETPKSAADLLAEADTEIALAKAKRQRAIDMDPALKKPRKTRSDKKAAAE